MGKREPPKASGGKPERSNYRLVPEHPVDTIHRLDDRLILIGSLHFVAVQVLAF